MAIYFIAMSVSIVTVLCSKHSRGVYLKWKNKEYNLMDFVAILSSIPLILVSGCRYGIGTDYESYNIYFNFINRGYRTHIEYLYYLLNLVCGKLNLEYTNFVMICAIGFVLMVYICIIDKSPYPWMSILLFVGMGYYFASFNIVREMIGAAILLFSINYVNDKKIVKFLMMVTIASGFHFSCIAFAIVYFVPEIKISSTRLLFISIGAILCAPVFNYAARIVIGYTKYGVYLDSVWDSGRTGYINLLLQFSILIFASFFSDNTREFNVLFNIQMINAFLGLLTSVPLVRRLQYLFGLPGIILIPFVLKNIPSKSVRNCAGICIVVLFLAYIIIITRAGYHGVIPYMSVYD